MYNLRISLFSKLQIQGSNEQNIKIEQRRAQELLCYLLIHRDQLHKREKLAAILWPEAAPEQSKRNLRQTLWQLQATINHTSQQEIQSLHKEYDRVGMGLCTSYWLDAAVLEDAFTTVKDKPGQDLCAQQAEQLRHAIQLYQGDLLEGWNQDWCILERDRLQYMYLAMLDKLLSYSEAQHEYEAAVGFGMQILRYDRAREHTHRQLMRLHALAGNRTAARHQYEACVAASTLSQSVKVFWR